jgi:hypothetical protein
MPFGVQKVYCDMDTDEGGWTLFLNYVHYPGSELKFSDNRIPNLKTNAHIYLGNLGLRKSDVKEIRFLCSEKNKEKGHYWHFKTYNDDVISVAFNGDQNVLKVSIL